MKNTENLIKRLDAYKALLSFKYTDLEKLSRLKILNDYYKSINKDCDSEKLQFTLDSAEQLSKDLILPLKVKGIFLTEGRPASKYYTKDELKKSIDNPINAKFPFMLDHEDNKVDKIIGMVDRIEYDESIKGIRYWGHINDEKQALNILDGVVTDVSATIYSASEYTKNGLTAKDLVFKELSLVIKGAEPNNTLEVDD
jgi:hypothetical protein